MPRSRRKAIDGGPRHRPTFADKAPLRLAEHEVPAELAREMMNFANSYVRAYSLGECSIMVTKEFGEWHLSIAHPRRYPTWDEIAEARYRILPDDVTMAMLLPPKAQYVNVHENCFQMVQLQTREVKGENE